MRVLYLHGFASSPLSSKATFFARKLAAMGVQMATPDLNAPDFSTLTVSRMLRQIAPLIDEDDDPLTLIGSSLGGFVAVQAAADRARDGRVGRVILLAPALDFSGNRLSQLGDRGLDEWRSTNRLEVFHYGYGRVMPVHYDLYADARTYDVFNAVVPQPVQVFQGRHDSSVDPATVEQWAAARPNVELHMLDDDHQLLRSLDSIWDDAQRFLFHEDRRPR